MISLKESKGLNLAYSNFGGTPWDLEKIGQSMENFERAEINIDELGEGIQALYFRTKNKGKIKISFETLWRCPSASSLPSPKRCAKVFVEGKVKDSEIKEALRVLQKHLKKIK